MNNYNELIGQLVEYRTESFQGNGFLEPNPVALGFIAKVAEDNTGDEYSRIEWLVTPQADTFFYGSEINKFGLTLKDNEEWGM